MHEVLTALVRAREPVPPQAWRSFWNRLDAGRLDPGEAAAVLASLASATPSVPTATALLATLQERRPPTTVRYPRAVNIVGTGGGPRTFNVSTASAFVAAAMGVRVVKTGSRAHTGEHGSLDLLERLGIRLTAAHEETVEVLDRFGVAFCGPFVYPREIGRLARAVFPIPMRVLGGAVNLLGPLLASVPVAAQVTGVSDHATLPLLSALAAARPGTRTWLCANDHGSDELLSGTDNTIHPDDGTPPITLRGTGFGHAPHDPAALAPAGGDELVPHFLGVLSGRCAPVVAQTVALNAAALAVADGRHRDWATAVAAAESVLGSGAALDLAERLRAARRPAVAGRRG